MCREKYIIHGVWYYPQFQPATRGLRTGPLRIRRDCGTVTVEAL